MKRLFLLVPTILIACGSQLVEFAADNATNNSDTPTVSPDASTTAPYPTYPPPAAKVPCNCGVNGNAIVPTAEICNNGVDDDGDGLIDCADPDCANNHNCILPVNDGGILQIDAETPSEDASIQNIDDGDLQGGDAASQPDFDQHDYDNHHGHYHINVLKECE